MALGPGTLIGTNVVLERQLGAGAMGEVWVAENRALQSKVAVKVLHRSLTGEDEALARFRQEARAVAGIDSPHVVQIFDFGMTRDGEPYIVMELLSGHDLGQLIDQRGPLPVDMTVKIVTQLCRALGRAHELGVIHRDIKPANVFIIESDGEPFVKVLDFGIARVHAAEMGMTETGAVMGTPYYMSPEQFVDPRRIDHRSDLWSAAVVTYGCLLGSLPFQGETIGALSLAVHSGTFELPSQLNSSLPVALDAFFQRALSVAASDRYATARELSTAFVAASGSVPSSQAPHLSAPQVMAPAPTGAALAETSLANNNPASVSSATETQPSKKSSSPMIWVGVVLAALGVGALVAAFVLPSLRADDGRSAKASDGDSESNASKKKGKKKKKKSGKKKKADAPEPAPPPTTTASTPPAPTASDTAAPAPAPSPTPVAPPPPKPEPTRYAATGTSCFALSDKTCPPASQCCRPQVGGMPRDVPRYQDVPGRERGSCQCMRPVCKTGEAWQTHHCIKK